MAPNSIWPAIVPPLQVNGTDPGQVSRSLGRGASMRVAKAPSKLTPVSHPSMSFDCHAGGTRSCAHSDCTFEGDTHTHAHKSKDLAGRRNRRRPRRSRHRRNSRVHSELRARPAKRRRLAQSVAKPWAVQI